MTRRFEQVIMKSLLIPFLALALCPPARSDIYQHQMSELSPDMRAASIASNLVCMEQSDAYAGLKNQGSWIAKDGSRQDIQSFNDGLEAALSSDHSLTRDEYRVIVNHPAWQPWFDHYVVPKHGCTSAGLSSLNKLPASERSEMATYGPAFLASASSMAAKCVREMGYTNDQATKFAYQTEESALQSDIGVSIQAVYGWEKIDKYNEIRREKHKKYGIGFNRYVFRITTSAIMN